MPATVSVIIPTRNQPTLMAEAVHAVLDQSRRVNEIIVRDSLPTDESRHVAETLRTILTDARDAPTFHYASGEDLGLAYAVNQASTLATGDYLWVCPPADRALPHTIEMLAGVLDAQPEVLSVAGKYRVLTGPGAGGGQQEPPNDWPDLTTGTPLRHLLEYPFLPLSAVMFRATAFANIGRFQDALKDHAGFDALIRLACAGPMVVLEDPVCLAAKPPHQAAHVSQQYLSLIHI